MYLLDTNVISELRKGKKSNAGVRSFMDEALANKAALFLSVITMGELQRGIELMRFCCYWG